MIQLDHYSLNSFFFYFVALVGPDSKDWRPVQGLVALKCFNCSRLCKHNRQPGPCTEVQWWRPHQPHNLLAESLSYWRKTNQ
jgi:hypothetical protein